MVDKTSEMVSLSIKRTVFMDKVSKMQLLSMIRGVFMDKVGEGGIFYWGTDDFFD